MRIGIITGEYPPMQGGVGDYSRELARALVDMGHELFILTSERARPVQGEPRITVQSTVSRWGRWRKSGKLPRGERQALDWVKANRLEVVNIQYQAAAFDMHLAANRLPHTLLPSVPVVTTFHDLLVPYLFPKAGPLRKRVVFQMARRSKAVIVTNVADERELRAAGDMPLMARIPIGSNIAVNPPAGFDRAAWRQQMHLPPEVFLIGYFGFINASKGIDTLAQAVRLLVEQGLNVELLIIGGQPGDSDRTNIQQADEAERLVGGLGINRRVRWTGFVAPELVSAYLKTSDVVALPYKDGVSFRRGTLMAALAHGCPIVTTYPQVETPGLKDGQAVRMVPANDPAGLANVLQELYGDVAARIRLGQAASELAVQFSWDSIANQVSSLMEWVIDEHKTQPHLFVPRLNTD